MVLRLLLLPVWNVLMVVIYVLQRLGFAVARVFSSRKRTWVRVVPPPRVRLQQTTGLRGLLSRTPTWLDWVEEMEALGSDPVVSGVVLDLGEYSAGLATSELVAERVSALRAAGKEVVTTGHVYDQGALVIASRANRVVLSPAGRVAMLGMHAQLLFWRELLDRLGVLPQFVHIGAYKTAAHGLLRSSSTPEQRESLEGLLDGLSKRVRDAVIEGRGLDASRYVEAERRGYLDGGRARALGLVDALGYEDTLESVCGGEDEAQVVKQSRFVGTPRLNWRPLLPPREIAVVEMRGVIVMGGEGGSGLRETVSYKRLRPVLESLRERRRVSAVVLRIDSPGGSALASDLLWRSCWRLAEEKPVVVSMGSVAASGGYYIASCGARRILAQGSTLTGSIGVVAGKLSVGGLLDQLNVGRERFGRGERAGFFSVAEGFSQEDLEVLRRDAWTVYRRFVARVSQGRGMTRDEVHALGEGRVFLGTRALEVGLVDELGDLHDALALAREMGEAPGATVRVYPTLRGGLRQMFQGEAEGQVWLNRMVEGLAWYRELSRERVWALMPGISNKQGLNQDLTM